MLVTRSTVKLNLLVTDSTRLTCGLIALCVCALGLATALIGIDAAMPLTGAVALTPPDQEFTLSTNDGLRLSLDEGGLVNSLRLDTTELLTGAGGFRLRELIPTAINRAPNPDFERGFGSPANWTLESPHWSWDVTVAHSGHRSAKIVVAPPTDTVSSLLRSISSTRRTADFRRQGNAWPLLIISLLSNNECATIMLRCLTNGTKRVLVRSLRSSITSFSVRSTGVKYLAEKSLMISKSCFTKKPKNRIGRSKRLRLCRIMFICFSRLTQRTRRAAL